MSGRRSYPTVLPKYRNLDQPLETWAGRGKQPRSLVAQLRSGKRIDDFRIKKAIEARPILGGLHHQYIRILICGRDRTRPEGPQLHMSITNLLYHFAIL